jgi:hypothetical protein
MSQPNEHNSTEPLPPSDSPTPSDESGSQIRPNQPRRPLSRRTTWAIRAGGIALGAAVGVAGGLLLSHPNSGPQIDPALRAIGMERYADPHILGPVRNGEGGSITITVKAPLSGDAQKYENANMGSGANFVNWKPLADVVTGRAKPDARDGAITSDSFIPGFDGTLAPNQFADRPGFAPFRTHTVVNRDGSTEQVADLKFHPNPADPEGTRVYIGIGEEADIHGIRVNGVQSVGTVVKHNGQWQVVPEQPGQADPLSQLPPTITQ